MRLVDVGNGTYVNIDLTLSVHKRGDQFFLSLNDASRSQYHISEKAYNNILFYGKAKV